MALNTYCLERVDYSEETRIIKAEFKGLERSKIIGFPFNPFIKFPLPLKGKTALEKILTDFEAKGFSISRDGNCAVVAADSFSQLKKLHKLLSLSLKIPIPLIEPERQFLIEKGWAYFDVFSINSPLKHIPLLSNYNKSIPLISGMLGGRIESNALEKIVFSNLLRVPVEAIPQTQEAIGRIVLENAFFSRTLGSESNGFCQRGAMMLNSSIKRIIEFNIGFDSLNCDCCKPSSLNEKNVLPSSLVMVEFFADGFYFQSGIPSFSKEFHLLHGKKNSREKRKKEFCLPFFPIGPFFARDKALIPFIDAKRLEKQGVLKILKEGHRLSWFCLKNESFLGKYFKVNAGERNAIESIANSMEKKAYVKNGLGAFAVLDSSLKHLFLKEALKAREIAERAVIECIKKGKTVFSNPELLKAIESAEVIPKSQGDAF